MAAPDRKAEKEKEENEKRIREETDLFLRNEAVQRRAQSQAAIKDKLVTQKDEAREQKAFDEWTKVGKKGEELSEKGMEGYMEWVSTMMNITNGCKVVNKACTYTVGNRPLEPGLKFVWEKTIGKALDVVSNKLEQKGWKKDTLAPLSYSLDVDENGKITSSATTHGKPLSATEIEHINTGVAAWAKLHGYKLENGNTLKNVETNQPMTPEKMVELNKNPDDNLQSFLSNRFKMEMKQTPTSKPA